MVTTLFGRSKIRVQLYALSEDPNSAQLTQPLHDKLAIRTLHEMAFEMHDQLAEIQ